MWMSLLLVVTWFISLPVIKGDNIMDEKLKNHLLAIAKTLEEIDLRGKDNMTRLLASIQHLEKLANGEYGDYTLK